MRLSVFGLGYVGCVSAACFANDGHTVIGVDVNPTKIDLINSGRSPIVEEGMDELLHRVVADKRLRATENTCEAIAATDLSLICVGTPSRANGSLDLHYVRQVCRQIGEALKQKNLKTKLGNETPGRHTVVVRSTMLPGSVEQAVVPELEAASGKRSGIDFDVCINPEFLREGTSIQDFYSPPFTLIGADRESVAATMRQLYSTITAPLLVTDIKAAEMVKYTCNCFHALKIGFANEIGNICKSMGVDSHEVMRIFCQDTKLNLSASYLKPGFAFGGSCLPKDLRAITYKAREQDIEAPMLTAILQSNRLQIDRALDMVLSTGRKRVGILGLSFKAGTDDLRESPIVTLTEALIGKGFQVAIYDRDVSLARLHGANKRYIECEIPHISQLMRSSISEVLDAAEVIVIGNNSPEYRQVESFLQSDRIIIDLVRVFERRVTDGRYQGLCW
jgi:GDP-mannose 6-dehydrogenase